jgi:hypothetical protein
MKEEIINPYHNYYKINEKENFEIFEESLIIKE